MSKRRLVVTAVLAGQSQSQVARTYGAPSGERRTDTHDRVRRDKIDKSGTVTLRVAGRLRHIGVGRTYVGTDVILLVQDLHTTIVNATTGEILRNLIIDPRKDYHPPDVHPGPQRSRPNLQNAGPAHSDVPRHHIGSGGRI